MIAWAVGWQELVAIFVSGLIVLPFIAGLVMLIVGLTTKKRGLWIAGLVLLLLPLLLLLIGALMLMVARLA
jgi:hypothetical protein